MSGKRLLQMERGNGNFGEKGLTATVEKMLALANIQALTARHVPRVVFLFTNGLPSLMERTLTSQGVVCVRTRRKPSLAALSAETGEQIELDDWKQLTPLIASPQPPSRSEINLDITCLLALISHTSHPGTIRQNGLSKAYTSS